MSEYGLRVRDEHGLIILDNIDRITRFLWMSSQTNTSGSVNLNGTGGLPDIQGLKTIELALPVNFSSTTTAPTITRTGTTINWTSYSSIGNFLQPGYVYIISFAYT